MWNVSLQKVLATKCVKLEDTTRIRCIQTWGQIFKLKSKANVYGQCFSVQNEKYKVDKLHKSSKRQVVNFHHMLIRFVFSAQIGFLGIICRAEITDNGFKNTFLTFRILICRKKKNNIIVLFPLVPQVLCGKRIARSCYQSFLVIDNV